MKKTSLIVLVLLILTGCGSNKAAIYDEKVKLYQSYWSAIQDQTKYQQTSNNFNIATSMIKAESGYQYDVILDQARIAMYDVEILIVEGEDPYHDEKMMPSIGIFDDVKYHLVPNQSRPDKSFQSGFKLSGEYDSEELTLHMIVTWRNYSRSEMYREYFELSPSIAAE